MHPAAWIVWATCAGLVAFTTTEPVLPRTGRGRVVVRLRGAARAGPDRAVVPRVRDRGARDDGRPHRARLLRHGRRRQRRVRRARGCPPRDAAGRVRHVQRRHRSVRRGAARAAAVPRAGARRGARPLDRPAHDRDGRHGCARRSACAGCTRRRVASPARPRGPGARDRDGGSRDARGEHGRPGARPRTPLALPARALDRSARSSSSPRRCRGRRVPRRARSPASGGAAPVDVPPHLAAGRPSCSWPRSGCSLVPALPVQAIGRPTKGRSDERVALRRRLVHLSRRRPARAARRDSVSIAEGTFALAVGADRRRQVDVPAGGERAGPALHRRPVLRAVWSSTAATRSSTPHASSPTSSRSCPRTPRRRSSSTASRTSSPTAWRTSGVDPAHMRRRVEEMLDLLDIEPLRRRSVRVALGRRAAARRDRGGARGGAPHPRARRADQPARPAGRRGRGRGPAAARPRPGHDRAARGAPARAGRRLRRPRARLRARHGRAPASRPSVIRRLAMGPPVARLGRLVGWDPVPLTVREARRLGGRLAPIELPASGRDVATSQPRPATRSCGSPDSTPGTASRPRSAASTSKLRAARSWP